MANLFSMPTPEEVRQKATNRLFQGQSATQQIGAGLAYGVGRLFGAEPTGVAKAQQIQQIQQEVSQQFAGQDLTDIGTLQKMSNAFAGKLMGAGHAQEAKQVMQEFGAMTGSASKGKPQPGSEGYFLPDPNNPSRAVYMTDESGKRVLPPATDIGLAVDKKTQLSQVDRRQSYISKGVTAAEDIRPLRDTLVLLKSVKTGGFNKAALKAKQLFGVESADEAELSYNMGKAVMKQLKPTFGAAFSAKEGQMLTDIEAGFGKSTEGNVRLIKKAIGIYERAMKRGMRAARADGDMDTYNEIKSALEVNTGKESYEAKKKRILGL